MVGNITIPPVVALFIESGYLTSAIQHFEEFNLMSLKQLGENCDITAGLVGKAKF